MQGLKTLCELLRGPTVASFSVGALVNLALVCPLASTRPARGSSGPLSQPADQFVRDVLVHEIAAQAADHSLWTFHELKIEGGERKLFYVCQTGEGEIQRLVAVNGQPLNVQQVRAEDNRIQRLLTHPAEMQEQRKKDHEDGEQALQLLKIFPQAFQFQYDSEQGSLVRVKFTPDPTFRPGSHAEQVFHQMQGTLLLDSQQKRLAAIDGRLTANVKFFGGLLGHLDKGGTFAVTQRNVGSDYWEVTAMKVQMSGRVLFFKTIAVHTDEQYSDYEPVPAGTDLRKAAELVKNAVARGLAPA
jgi:hypothetical protein